MAWEVQSGERAAAMLNRRFAEQFESMGAQSRDGAAPEMQGLVESIMQQLLSKEVLYQPMKVTHSVPATADLVVKTHFLTQQCVMTR